LRFTEKELIEWDIGAYDHNVYRGNLAVLRETGANSQDTSSVPVSRRFVECSFWLPDEFVPAPGEGVFYLVVTYVLGEGTLGFDSEASERSKGPQPDWGYCLD
jgi:hypothetical protein